MLTFLWSLQDHKGHHLIWVPWVPVDHSWGLARGLFYKTNFGIQSSCRRELYPLAIWFQLIKSAGKKNNKEIRRKSKSCTSYVSKVSHHKGIRREREHNHHWYRNQAHPLCQHFWPTVLPCFYGLATEFKANLRFISLSSLENWRHAKELPASLPGMQQGPKSHPQHRVLSCAYRSITARGFSIAQCAAPQDVALYTPYLKVNRVWCTRSLEVTSYNTYFMLHKTAESFAWVRVERTV